AMSPERTNRLTRVDPPLSGEGSGSVGPSGSAVDPPTDPPGCSMHPTHLEQHGGSMNRDLSRRLVVVAVFAILVAGCGKSNRRVAPSEPPGANAPRAPAGLDVLTGWGRSDVLAGLPFGVSWPFGLPISIPSGCSFDSGSQSFVCGPNSLPNGLVE